MRKINIFTQRINKNTAGRKPIIAFIFALKAALKVD